MVNIYDIVQILVPEYKIVTEKKNLIIKDIEKAQLTDFEYNDSFVNLYSCILYQIDINFINNIEYITMNIEKLKNYIETYDFNPLINIKKILNYINQNIINNELILFLSEYYNINIYLYSFDNKLLKIYYFEEKLIITKKSLVIIHNKDTKTPNMGYQTLLNRQLFLYTDNFIQNLCENIYIIAIGLKENKKFIINDNPLNIENNCFVIGKKNLDILNLDDNIFINNNMMEDDSDYKSPFDFKINIKKINKKYSIENLMKLIKIYY